MKDLYVVLDNIRSLENIGSIFRTSDALGVAQIYLCGVSAVPPVGEKQEKFLKRKIAKTAIGAEDTVPFGSYKSTSKLIDRLKKDKIKVVALEQDPPARRAGKKAVLYTKFKPVFPLALIAGNEVKGISKTILKKCDKIIYLPMSGQKESLNVSVAFGIAGYHIRNYY